MIEGQLNSGADKSLFLSSINGLDVSTIGSKKDTHNQGLNVDVEIYPKHVLLKSKNGSPQAKGTLEQKVWTMHNTRDFFTRHQVDGLCFPKLVGKSEAGYVFERAKGLHLSRIHDSNRGDFSHAMGEYITKFNFDKRIQGMLIYLQMLDELHNNGYVFKDHKTDSIFMDLDENKRTTITVVDVDGVAKYDSGSQKGRIAEQCWSKVDAEDSNGLQNTLKSFFTLGMMDDDSFLMPEGLIPLLSNLHQYKSADELISKITDWQNSSEGRQQIIELEARIKRQFHQEEVRNATPIKVDAQQVDSGASQNMLDSMRIIEKVFPESVCNENGILISNSSPPSWYPEGQSFTSEDDKMVNHNVYADIRPLYTPEAKPGWLPESVMNIRPTDRVAITLRFLKIVEELNNYMSNMSYDSLRVFWNRTDPREPRLEVYNAKPSVLWGPSTPWENTNSQGYPRANPTIAEILSVFWNGMNSNTISYINNFTIPETIRDFLDHLDTYPSAEEAIRAIKEAVYVRGDATNGFTEKFVNDSYTSLHYHYPPTKKYLD